jgi:hypothetical protein
VNGGWHGLELQVRGLLVRGVWSGAIPDGRSKMGDRIGDMGYGRWVVGGVVKRGLGWWNRVWLWGEEAW